MKLDRLKMIGIVAIVLLYKGAQWQLNVIATCLDNDWFYGWPFEILWPSPWIAQDFWFVILDLCLIIVLLLADKEGSS